jgi:hypothetical protein
MWASSTYLKSASAVPEMGATTLSFIKTPE